MSTYAIVLVTYNRVECLKKSLPLYFQQTHKPSVVIVVDNASTDDTPSYLDEFASGMSSDINFKVVSSETNTGGAGGFALGMEAALGFDTDFIFLADDDAYPDMDMLYMLDSAYEQLENKNEVVAMCTSVWEKDDIAYYHRRRIEKSFTQVYEHNSTKEDYSKEVFQIDLLSFVGAAIKRSVVVNIGIPDAGYFIYFDDTEYSLRLREHGMILCAPQSVMRHESQGGGATNIWREYYGTRNHLDCIRRHFPPRYFYRVAIILWIASIPFVSKMRGVSDERRIMRRSAVRDALEGNIEISKIYKPGKVIE